MAREVSWLDINKNKHEKVPTKLKIQFNKEVIHINRKKAPQVRSSPYFFHRLTSFQRTWHNLPTLFHAHANLCRLFSFQVALTLRAPVNLLNVG